MEMDDDVFFADLSKQISSLISEEDEENNTVKVLPTQYFPVTFQSNMHSPVMIMKPTYAYDFSFTRESRGTGVFIPKSSIARKKIKSEKPQSVVTNSQANQFNRKVSKNSQISNISEFNHNTNHYKKSGGVEKLNG